MRKQQVRIPVGFERGVRPGIRFIYPVIVGVDQVCSGMRCQSLRNLKKRMRMNNIVLAQMHAKLSACRTQRVVETVCNAGALQASQQLDPGV